MAHLPPETEAVVLEEVVLAGAPLLTVLAPFAHLNPLVVGHNPTISQLASRLLDASGHLPFDKATAACFRLNRLPPTAPGELVFFAPAALSACE
jgi:phosphohistidine phosphatase SixA